MRDWELTEEHKTPDGIVRWTRLGEGPPLALLHGTPFSSVVWRDIARALAARHEVFVWDMLGYGQSEMRDGQDVSLRAQGEIFASLLDVWGLERPAVVAHDFGGAVSLRAHLLHGKAYERLALVDVVAMAPWGSPSFRHIGANADAFAGLPANLHRALVREYVGTASGPGLRADVLEDLVEPWLSESGQPAFYRQIAQADQRYTDEIEPRFGELDLPVLVCWGTADTWIPPERGHALASRIPGAELRLFEGAGHLAPIDAPAQLTAALTDFLPTT